MTKPKCKTRPGVGSRAGSQNEEMTVPSHDQNYQNSCPPATSSFSDQDLRPLRREDYQTLKGEQTGPVERIRIGRAIIKERARPTGPKSLGLMRQREIERLITRRHGTTVPDPLDTDDRETALAYPRAVAFSMTGQSITDWSARWAPWMRDDEIDAIEWEGRQRGRTLRADAVARLLNVSYGERLRLKLRTIGSCDMERSERDELARSAKRKRDRERQDRISREAGRKIRGAEGSKPWEVEGVSRRTWYRQKAWHSNIANKSLNTTGDNSVPNPLSTLLKEDSEGSEMPRGQHETEPSPYLGAVSDVEKRVPRPQALVAEGSAPQGRKAAKARTYEIGLSPPRDNSPSIPDVTTRRTA